MLTYVEAPYEVPANAPRPFVFLGGSVTESENWQQTVVAALADCQCTLISPRRAEFPGRSQIEWEFDKLWNFCDIFTMWLTNSADEPIRLYELGAAMARHRVAKDHGHGVTSPFAALVVGCNAEYERKFNIQVQSTLVLGQEAVPHTDLDEHIGYIRKAVEMFHQSTPETEDETEGSEDGEQDEYPEE